MSWEKWKKQAVIGLHQVALRPESRQILADQGIVDRTDEVVLLKAMALYRQLDRAARPFSSFPLREYEHDHLDTGPRHIVDGLLLHQLLDRLPRQFETRDLDIHYSVFLELIQLARQTGCFLPSEWMPDLSTHFSIDLEDLPTSGPLPGNRLSAMDWLQLREVLSPSSLTYLRHHSSWADLLSDQPDLTIHAQTKMPHLLGLMSEARYWLPKEQHRQLEKLAWVTPDEYLPCLAAVWPSEAHSHLINLLEERWEKTAHVRRPELPQFLLGEPSSKLRRALEAWLLDPGTSPTDAAQEVPLLRGKVGKEVAQHLIYRCLPPSVWGKKLGVSPTNLDKRSAHPSHTDLLIAAGQHGDEVWAEALFGKVSESDCQDGQASGWARAVQILSDSSFLRVYLEYSQRRNIPPISGTQVSHEWFLSLRPSPWSKDLTEAIVQIWGQEAGSMGLSGDKLANTGYSGLPSTHLFALSADPAFFDAFNGVLRYQSTEEEVKTQLNVLYFRRRMHRYFARLNQ